MKPSYIHTILKPYFRVPSPAQSRSQALVCVSTPRMYLRSGYFLVYVLCRKQKASQCFEIGTVLPIDCATVIFEIRVVTVILNSFSNFARGLPMILFHEFRELSKCQIRPCDFADLKYALSKTPSTNKFEISNPISTITI